MVGVKCFQETWMVCSTRFLVWLTVTLLRSLYSLAAPVLMLMVFGLTMRGPRTVSPAVRIRRNG